MHGPDARGPIGEEDGAPQPARRRVGTSLTSLPHGTSAADVTRTAHVCLSVCKAGLELVLAHQGAGREAYVQELKKVPTRYLEPLAATPAP
ncbi:hypothetical protein ACWCPM_01460 [Streptomyces sp. NPDC002309]